MANAIQILEDERMVSDVPLLVLSGEVFFIPLLLMGTPFWGAPQGAGVRDFS
jgi:hypothetical protein